jgi:pimeloyl-ACP methyl ester carboxylesterase
VDANIAFIQSGGYRIAGRLGQVTQPTLVMWGRNDKILPPEAAEQVAAQLPDARLVWAESSGHCPHLEEPDFTARTILEFVGAGVPVGAQ